MSFDTPPGTPRTASWRESRYGFVLFLLLSVLAGWLVLRLVLLVTNKAMIGSLATVALALLAGAQRDLWAGGLLLVPLLFWLWVVSDKRWPGRWHRRLFWSVALLLSFANIFLLFVEYYFFDEFRSRFNTVAVDYLLYPHEVFINIWDSYHVGWVLLFCLSLAAAWVYVAKRLFAEMWTIPVSRKVRFTWLVAALAVVAALTPTISFRGAQVSANRTLNEIANNSAISFGAAAWTRHLDYAAFYRVLSKDEAYARARRLLAATNSVFVEPGQSIHRQILGDASRPKLNLVICLEESLGSEFWGCLGRTNSLTPEMDKLVANEGMLFTQLYASGNRTVRGLEGVLSSFPPLPGDSIVRRDRSDNVETIARILKRDGYGTVFLYGGRGVFDGMRSYAVRNGYDRFVEQKHFEKPEFTTIWGVSDEDLFKRTIEECRAMAASGQPFLATVLTVSNHKPYTYPTGRIPEDPARHKRQYAVKYSDYALGRFFEAAKKEAFWTNTVFAVVADHGARVYGNQSIPIGSYKIPLVVAGPAVVEHPKRVSALGGSLDVSPTLLGLIGRPYESMFFGRDLLRAVPEETRALLQHNRDIGMLAADRMVVLGLMQTVEFYSGNPAREAMQLVSSPGDRELELEKDATALYQVADDLYVNRRYRVDAAGSRSTSTSTPVTAAVR